MLIRMICARVLLASLVACAAMKPAAVWVQAQASNPGDMLVSNISGPVLGFVFDADAGAFRRVLGIPGAAVLSNRLSVTATIQHAEIAGTLALATVGDEQAPAVIRLTDDPPSFHLLDGALPAPSKIVLSPNGTAAALYYKQAGKLQIISDLSTSPAVTREIPIPEPSAVISLAINDDAHTVLVGRFDAGSGSVSMITSDGFEVFLFSVTEPSAIAYLGKSSDALVSDAASNTVYIVRNGGGNIERSVVGTASDGLAAPVALAASNDGHWAFAVNVGAGTVIALDLTGGPSRTFACSCQAGFLHGLGRGSVFRLSASSSPMWFLTTDRAESPLFFVPPAADSLPAPEDQQNGDAL